MKRYIKSAKDLKMRLPHLDKAIADSKNTEFELFDDCDFQYRVEDDGVDGSILIWLADYNENIGSSEYYEYSFVNDLFKKFETAVKRDTGDIDFMFDPYDSVEFCGRAWLHLKNNEHIFPNSIR